MCNNISSISKNGVMAAAINKYGVIKRREKAA